MRARGGYEGTGGKDFHAAGASEGGGGRGAGRARGDFGRAARGRPLGGAGLTWVTGTRLEDG